MITGVAPIVACDVGAKTLHLAGSGAQLAESTAVPCQVQETGLQQWEIPISPGSHGSTSLPTS